MYHPTTRVLTVLELLQARHRIGGTELAERLEVDKRTIRRYITMLQDLGIPVETERGRYGGYRIRGGHRLPPMMFTDDEALAVVLGLLAARRLGLTASAPDTEGALAKIERVLPDALREQVRAVQGALSLDLTPAEAAPTSGTVTLISRAITQRRPVWLRYTAGYDKGTTERVIEPYGIVYRAGRWYAVGFCRLRTELRCFRLDRIEDAELREGVFFRPDEFDPVAFLLDSLARVPEEWDVELLLETTIEEARDRIPPALALLEEVPGGVQMRNSVGDLDWLARDLASLPFAFSVIRPVELQDALARQAELLLANARRPIPIPEAPVTAEVAD
ncbi:MAG TPA: YafY family protein [Thermomicrobiales bacterium]|nr:YafY family protein [Thermomicrobiales bacterium]